MERAGTQEHLPCARLRRCIAAGRLEWIGGWGFAQYTNSECIYRASLRSAQSSTLSPGSGYIEIPRSSSPTMYLNALTSSAEQAERTLRSECDLLIMLMCPASDASARSRPRKCSSESCEVARSAATVEGRVDDGTAACAFQREACALDSSEIPHFLETRARSAGVIMVGGGVARDARLGEGCVFPRSFVLARSRDARGVPTVSLALRGSAGMRGPLRFDESVEFRVQRLESAREQPDQEEHRDIRDRQHLFLQDETARWTIRAPPETGRVNVFVDATHAPTQTRICAPHTRSVRQFAHAARLRCRSRVFRREKTAVARVSRVAVG